jgi:hypothetical protein
VTHVETHSSARSEPFDALQRQRLLNAVLVGLALISFLIGTYWDIQWHASVGRDRVLTPPHLMMLAGIALVGLASLTWILLETFQARRHPVRFSGNSSRMFGVFRSSVGFAVAGFGALFSGIAFPLDDYWHSLYGIDVTLWAPFHVMIIAGMVMGGLGLAYTLMAERHRATGTARVVFGIAFAVTLGITLGTVFLLLPPAIDTDGIVTLFGQPILLYPVLVSFAVPLGLFSGALTSGTPGTATITALSLLLIRQLGEGFVPWATDALVTAQGLEYRPGGPNFVVATLALPGAILVASLLIDTGLWIANRFKPFAIPILFTSSVIASLATVLISRPWAIDSRLPRLFPEVDLSGAFTNAVPPALIAALCGAFAAQAIARGFQKVRG